MYYYKKNAWLSEIHWVIEYSKFVSFYGTKYLLEKKRTNMYKLGENNLKWKSIYTQVTVSNINNKCMNNIGI